MTRASGPVRAVVPAVVGTERADARGSASVVALAVGLALLLVGLGFQSVGAAVVARHRAGLAADLAALAGALHTAEGPAAACARAHAIAAENGAALIDCTVADTDVTVTVAVVPLGPAARVGHAVAVARAGPVVRAGQRRARPADRRTGQRSAASVPRWPGDLRRYAAIGPDVDDACHDAGDTLLMLKSGTRSVGIAVRWK